MMKRRLELVLLLLLVLTGLTFCVKEGPTPVIEKLHTTLTIVFPDGEQGMDSVPDLPPDSIPDFSDGLIADIDGNIYNTVRIGTQTWMAENLKTTRYNDGSQIPEVNGGHYWVDLKTGAYLSLNDIAYKNTYGLLYNWYAVKTGKLCPTGWHVASDDEWKQLEIELGMTKEEADSWGGEDYGDIGRGTDQGTQLKATSGWIEWLGIDGNGTNTSGFSALPGGDTGWDGMLEIVGQCGSWWSPMLSDISDAESASNSAVARVLGSGDGKVGRGVFYKQVGFSVRCLKNQHAK